MLLYHVKEVLLKFYQDDVARIVGLGIFTLSVIVGCYVRWAINRTYAFMWYSRLIYWFLQLNLGAFHCVVLHKWLRCGSINTESQRTCRTLSAKGEGFFRLQRLCEWSGVILWSKFDEITDRFFRIHETHRSVTSVAMKNALDTIEMCWYMNPGEGSSSIQRSMTLWINFSRISSKVSFAIGTLRYRQMRSSFSTSKATCAMLSADFWSEPRSWMLLLLLLLVYYRRSSFIMKSLPRCFWSTMYLWIVYQKLSSLMSIQFTQRYLTDKRN